MAKPKSVYDERYRKWALKIKDTDPLESEKEEKIDAAVYLGYKDDVLQALVRAKTEAELYRIMTTARQSA